MIGIGLVLNLILSISKLHENETIRFRQNCFNRRGKMTTFTIRDCLYAIEKRYGIVMEDTGHYPAMYVWSNNRYSIKLYRTYLGELRIFVMPLHDIMSDTFYDIKELEDIYKALDPIQCDIAVRQTDMWGAYAEG